MLAFLSVAILPSLTIIIISNNIIKETISDLITDETIYALEESINLRNVNIRSLFDISNYPLSIQEDDKLEQDNIILGISNRHGDGELNYSKIINKEREYFY